MSSKYEGWLVLDLETTVQKIDGKWDNSPKNPNNKMVSAHYAWITADGLGEVTSDFYHHKELKNYGVWNHALKHPDDPRKLMKALKKAKGCIAHNRKFDSFWLRETGFKEYMPENWYCTMQAEYLLAKGQRTELSLSATSERYNVTRKKSDLVDDMFRQGTGFEEMPIKTVREYAEADVISCGEIFLAQQARFEEPDNVSLLPVLQLTSEMTEFLLEIESNGCQIDMNVLLEVEHTYKTEQSKLLSDLTRIIEEVMGDTPINLNSGQDLTKVVYSRQVIDREVHRSEFNIGVNAAGKPLRPTPMNKAQLTKAVRKTTQKVYRTEGMCCKECKGSGTIQKYKKNGDPWKNRTKCPVCSGVGALYIPTGKIAGLKLIPTVSADASINGFKTDKLTIKKLIDQAYAKDNLTAVEFLTKITRLNAISTYLDSFVSGIKTWTRSTGLLHSTFNQTVTATGRLSSTNPNFQNLPKGNKFEVRRAIISRFAGGSCGEMDFSGLEFRVAGMLSKDQQIIDDVLVGKDVHRQTASIILQKPEDQVTKEERGQAKSKTFQPLYGGIGMGEPDHVRAYFSSYFKIYQGLARWHKSLGDEVLNRGYIQTPSGRQFAFPNAKRLRNGRITNHTQVVNFPCQSFATADIVPLACIRALRKFREMGLLSKLILSVHDSIVVDIHPTEIQDVGRALQWAMSGVDEELQHRFGYQAVLPLDTEYAVGSNWMNIEEISVDMDT